MIPTRFPMCKLLNIRIVDALPSGFPMATNQALMAIYGLQDEAYRELGTLEPDTTGALAALDRADICCECISQRARHPWLKRLRGAKPALVCKLRSDGPTNGNGREEKPIRLRGRVVA